MEASRVLTSEVGTSPAVKRGRIIRIRQEVVDFTYTSKADFDAAFDAARIEIGLPEDAHVETIYQGKGDEPDRFIFEE